jgi:hypothetical protein
MLQCSASLQAHIPVTVLVVQVVTFSIHQLGAAQVGVPLTLVNTSQLFQPLGTQVGIAQPSAIVLLLAHRTTRFHCVGVAGNVKASCFQLIVVAYPS